MIAVIHGKHIIVLLKVAIAKLSAEMRDAYTILLRVSNGFWQVRRVTDMIISKASAGIGFKISLQLVFLAILCLKMASTSGDRANDSAPNQTNKIFAFDMVKPQKYGQK